VIGNKILTSHNLAKSKQDLLLRVVSYVPLISKDSQSHIPFCAKSEAEFLEWNIGKQRAAEVS